jgi:uncharacterized membrane protein YdcZ (DUF606 family)
VNSKLSESLKKPFFNEFMKIFSGLVLAGLVTLNNLKYILEVDSKLFKITELFEKFIKVSE